jgi:hypothetical protein
MFLPSLNIAGALLLASALPASITLSILLDRRTSPESVRTNGLGIRLLSAAYWLAAMSTMVGVVLLAFALIVPLMIAAFAGGD